jgi:2-polyprenyl-6-methoxyphenol hydroxylase-like FAD-dependent oxidoreductase
MSVLVIGGGICGLGTALLLARDGHDVTVVERDPDAVPESASAAWDSWARKGVAQFRQPHNFMPGLRLMLEKELPDVQDALCRAGASRFDLLNPLPPFFRDRSRRAIDEKLWTYTARRPVGEWVFAKTAQDDRRINVRRGVQVTGLLTGTAALPGTPHVTGVQTADGQELRADLVIDATGRQSPCAKWLEAIGSRLPYEEQSDCGFIYYTRYFRGTLPERIGPTLTPLPTFSILTLPGDNETWSITIFTASGDQPLKNLRHDPQWTKVVQACPLQAHWLDGDPITGVLPAGGIVDRYRRFIVDSSPVVTGFVAVADAWACTNPSAGRGLTIGFMHALCLRDVLRNSIDDPGVLAEEFDLRTETEIAPWYSAQVAFDRARFAEMEAVREGRKPEPPEQELARDIQALLSTMMVDPDLFRLALEYIGTVTPVQEILSRPGVSKAICAAQKSIDNKAVHLPGPNRQQVEELLN